MTPADITHARAQLAVAWGLARPLTAAQLGRVLQLEGRDPGATIRRWERGVTPVPGLARVALGGLLAGFRPANAPEGAEVAQPQASAPGLPEPQPAAAPPLAPPPAPSQAERVYGAMVAPPTPPAPPVAAPLRVRRRGPTPG